jgi:hypothetical protein
MCSGACRLVRGSDSGSTARKLGLGYLARYRTAFDFPQRRLCLRPSSHFQDPPLYNHSGLELLRKEGKTRIKSVRSGYPGYAAGLGCNDEIVSIGGKPAKEYTLNEIYRLFSRRGVPLALRVMRDGQVRDFSMVLRD